MSYGTEPFFSSSSNSYSSLWVSSNFCGPQAGGETYFFRANEHGGALKA